MYDNVIFHDFVCIIYSFTFIVSLPTYTYMTYMYLTYTNFVYIFYIYICIHTVHVYYQKPPGSFQCCIRPNQKLARTSDFFL